MHLTGSGDREEPGERLRAVLATLELLRRGVVVHPGHFYSFDEEPRLVVSLIVEPRVFAEGLARMESLIAEI